MIRWVFFSSLGWMTVGVQSTSGLPLVRPRTTVNSEAYDRGLLSSPNFTVAFTVKGTFAPVASPGVITAPVMCACSL